jgi:SPP1 gp7 family putative phage head morphogenesis protein
MHTIEKHIYRKAFNLYLRKGIAIERTLHELLRKQEHPTTHYIWRTRGDDKVRSSHAGNNGKIFAWDNPPETGHPAQDYGCRCVAEPYFFNQEENANQKLITIIDEGLDRWEWNDFIFWFYFGGGDTVTLWAIGHLKEIISHLEHFVVDEKSNTIYERFQSQIVYKVRKLGEGDVYDDFYKSYDFKPVSYPHGNATIRGNFSGNAIQQGDYYIISGIIKYEFIDLFTDPARLRDKIFNGTSDPQKVSEVWRWISDFAGTPYEINDFWQTQLTITAQRNQEGSIFE